MNIVRNESISPLKYKSNQLINSMLSPLCGMNQEIGYVSRTHYDMNLMVGSAALTGIHVLFNRPNPGRGAYHIGGTGIFPNESMIRILGESVERYAQLMSDFSCSSQLKYARYADLLQGNDDVLPLHYLCLYSNNQLLRAAFPFQKIAENSQLSWIKMFSCYEQSSVWIPAQLVLVGYNVKKDDGEPWITSAVTTGTAAHINYQLACKAALLELIQLDTVMGHWYSDWNVYEIQLDDRVSSLTTLIKRYTQHSLHRYIFYYIPNPDLAGFTIACVYLQDAGLPKVVIGLGADTSLENAMYKAFLETVASVGLARMLVFKGKYKIDAHNTPIVADALYDLDRNVEYYGAGHNISRIEERFLNMPSIKASSLPEDIIGTHAVQLNKLVKSFSASHKKLYYLDLSGIEEKALGFKVVRMWSPDTLSLCLPSAPQIIHPRFIDYGDIKHEDPHPYP
jgi:thiazole/oxazole-forming peptide maturase SagD family component